MASTTSEANESLFKSFLQYIIWNIKFILSTITSNFPLLILTTLFIIIVSRFYYSTKEKYDEMNLFNSELMSEEERKLYFFTKRLTTINEKSYKKPEVFVNKGMFNMLI